MKLNLTILLLFLIIGSLPTLVFGNTPKVQLPNIIFIYSDDQRYDALGVNDNDRIITPQLDNIASRAMRFTNANVVFSLCSPSRAALLTGRYGSANGVLNLGSDLNSTEKTVAQYLKEKGYLTGISGKWHIGRHPVEAGFDFSVWFEGNGTYYSRPIYDRGKTVHSQIHCDAYCVNRSIDFIKNATASDKPFFLFHNTQLPHMNGALVWDALQKTKEKYDVNQMPVARNRSDDLVGKPDYLKTVRNRTQALNYGYPDSLAIQNHTRDYYSVITEVDDFLGQLFQAIKELDLLKNTYIFFMSDNGWMLGDHGFTSKVLPYRPSTRVPFFVVGPKLKPSSSNQLILNIDMAPTILELAGIKTPDNIHGKSILPILKGKEKGWRSAFVYEGLGTYGGAKPNLTVISSKYRYIVTYNDNTLNQIIFSELYDQQNDPWETNNLADKKSLQSVIIDFENLINQHKKNILKIN